VAAADVRAALATADDGPGRRGVVGGASGVDWLRWRHKKGGYVALAVTANPTERGLICVYREARGTVSTDGGTGDAGLAMAR